MQLLVYLLVYPILWIISRLPFTLLYLLSDALYYLLYHVIGYRKKVVHANLQLAFPEKDGKDIMRIKKAFYSHMCDVFVEIIKTMGMTAKQMEERFEMHNHDIINQMAAQQRSTVLFAGHYASWEWLLALNVRLNPKAYAIYQKIENPYFDKLVQRIRGTFGTTLLRTYESRQRIADLVENGQTFVLGLASDQSPMLSKAKHWMEFMGVRVPIHVGAEKMCKEHDLVPIFLKVEKKKRGYYKATFEIITEEPKNIPDFGISEHFMKSLEQVIRKKPEYYFWTHKRWKHAGKEPQTAVTKTD